MDTNAPVTKNDSVNDISTSSATNPLAYTPPLLTSYVGDTPLARSSVHDRTSLPAFYFQNPDTTSFLLNTTHSDTYGTHLAATATPSVIGGYAGPLTSGEKNFALMPETGTVPLASKPGLATDFTNVNLVSNASLNSQSKYRLRLYDNTVDASGNAGNYSETAFYAVRDNTAPNMLAAAIDKKPAIEKLLGFNATTTVWDTTTTNPLYAPETTGMVSKFIAANDTQTLYSTLSDTGVTNGGQNELSNAGLDKAGLKIDIEQSGSTSMFDTVFTYTDRFSNSLTRPKNFSNVDLVRSNGYRKYATNFTGGGLPGVCDLVGNCLNPKLSFRVVA